uniref:Uncharacterized protein n=1 Tax=Rhizophora mucronata TaxID=61149 RepID=A0A2P2PUN5_RHIMU
MLLKMISLCQQANWYLFLLHLLAFF